MSRIKLCRLDELEMEIRREVRLTREAFQAVTPIGVTGDLFPRIRFHRNNRRYRLPLAVCRLLHRALMPSERAGSSRFHEILEDEKAMARIFEKFVRNFADAHLQNAKVSAMKIKWDGAWDVRTEAILPQMLTDVTIERPGSKMILDCKFYREALIGRHEAKKLHSSHLYQLVAYLRNQAVNPGWEHVSGLLLYPAVEHRFDHKFVLNSHPIRVVSLDLDRPWTDIRDRLLEVLRV